MKKGECQYCHLAGWPTRHKNPNQKISFQLGVNTLSKCWPDILYEIIGKKNMVSYIIIWMDFFLHNS